MPKALSVEKDIDKNRPTPYRLPRLGNGFTVWLTKKDLEMAHTIGIEWFPTWHGTAEDGVECPAPEICGWFCSREDAQRLQRALDRLQIKPEKQIVSKTVTYADGSQETINYE